MASKFKRSRLWVDTPFQARLLLRMGAYLLVFAVFVFHFGFAFYFMKQLMASAPTNSLGAVYWEYLGQQLPLLLAFVSLAPIFVFDLLKFSNRIAGPLVRCRRMLNEMAQGKHVAEFEPRKHDLFTGFFQAFNSLIRTWNRRVDSPQRSAVVEESREMSSTAAG